MNRSMFPNIPLKVLRKINHDIDNPTQAQRKISSTYNTKIYDFLDLSRTPHRRFTHNLPMLLLIGYKLYGIEGAKVAISHAIADSISDRMRQRYGRKYRDVFETLYDLYYSTRD